LIFLREIVDDTRKKGEFTRKKGEFTRKKGEFGAFSLYKYARAKKRIKNVLKTGGWQTCAVDNLPFLEKYAVGKIRH
jgi:hypothetical protein